MKDEIVVYKLSSGEPQIARDKKSVRPLGPLQEIDNLLFFNVVKQVRRPPVMPNANTAPSKSRRQSSFTSGMIGEKPTARPAQT